MSTAFHFTNDEIFQKCFDVCVFGCLDQIGPDAGGGGNEDHPKIGIELLLGHLFDICAVLKTK